MSPIAAVLTAPFAAVPAHAFAAATPAPTPVPQAQTGPGIAGFLVTFALVLVCIPLFLSMTRKIRGVGYRDAGAHEAPGGDVVEGAEDGATDTVPGAQADRTGPDAGTPQP